VTVNAYFGLGLETPARLLVTIGWGLVAEEEVSVMIGLGIIVFGWVGSIMIGGVMRIFVLGVMNVIGTLGRFCVGGSGEPVEADGIWGKGSVTVSSGE
jgi:hypothetical protein